MSEEIERVIRGIHIFYAVGLFIGFLRIGIRTYINKKPGIEEILMAVSMVFWTGDVTLSSVTLRKGTNQMSPGDRASLTPEEIIQHEDGSKALITAWFCYLTFIWGAKTCLLLFYRKLLVRIERVWVIKVAGWALGVSYVGTCLGMFLVCRPFRKNWQVVPDPGSQCTDGYAYVWLIGITNILTDALLLVIPLPVIAKLQISKIKKFFLSLLFGSGIFVMVATSLRIHFTIGGDIVNLCFWCMIETTSAMAVVNAPGIVSIYGHIKGRNNSQNSYKLRGSNGSKGTSNRSGLSGSGKFGEQSVTTTCCCVCEHRTGLRPPSSVGPGESRERIVTDNQLDLETGVIHHNVSYTVTTELAGDPGLTKSVRESETLPASPPHTARKRQSMGAI